MNELSNHDHSRFLTRTNKMVGRVATSGTKAAQENINEAILAGCNNADDFFRKTHLYYGEKQSLWMTDPDNRRTHPWGKKI